jgi:hypothetical protein
VKNSRYDYLVATGYTSVNSDLTAKRLKWMRSVYRTGRRWYKTRPTPKYYSAMIRLKKSVEFRTMLLREPTTRLAGTVLLVEIYTERAVRNQLCLTIRFGGYVASIPLRKFRWTMEVITRGKWEAV